MLFNICLYTRVGRKVGTPELLVAAALHARLSLPLASTPVLAFACLRLIFIARDVYERVSSYFPVH